MRHKNKPGIEPWSPVVIVFGLAVAFVVGAAYGLAPAYNPFGIANVIALAITVFPFGFAVFHTVRIAKVRGDDIGFCLGIAMAIAVVAGTFATPLVVAGQGTGLLAHLSDRLANGLPLFGATGFRLTGVWLIVAWVLAGLLLAFAGLSVGVSEAGRPFCADCKTWARRRLWQSKFSRPDPGLQKAIERDPTVQTLDLVRAGAGPQNLTLRVGIQGCKCGRVAILRYETLDSEPGGLTQQLGFDSALTPFELRRALAWAQRVSPTSAIPRIALAETERTPFAESTEPIDGEHVLQHRPGKAFAGIDQWADVPFTAALRERLMDNGDFRSIKEAAKLARSHEDFGFVMEAAADWAEPPAWLDDWEAEQPNSKLLPLVRGMQAVRHAWTARGGGWVPKNFGLFQERLESARLHLDRAAALNPRDPTPWAWMIYAAKGQQRDQHELKSLFREAIERDPSHRQAHSFLASAFSPKWGGTPELTLAVARRAARAGGRYATTPVVVAEVHLDLAYDEAGYKKVGQSELRAYLSRSAVAQEVANAARSVFPTLNAVHPSMQAPRARAYFAFTTWLGGKNDIAADLIARLPRRAYNGPFGSGGWFGSPNSVARAKKELGVQ